MGLYVYGYRIFVYLFVFLWNIIVYYFILGYLVWDYLCFYIGGKRKSFFFGFVRMVSRVIFIRR